MDLIQPCKEACGIAFLWVRKELSNFSGFEAKNQRDSGPVDLAFLFSNVQIHNVQNFLLLKNMG